MGAFNQFLIHKQLDIYIPEDKIKDSLDNYEGSGFTIEQVSDNEYKFVSTYSLGTFFSRYSSKVGSIKVDVMLEPFDRISTHLTFRTRLRPELIFITMMAIVSSILVFYDRKTPPFHDDLWLIPVMPVWFWLVYRVQEYYLLTKIEKYLNSLK